MRAAREVLCARSDNGLANEVRASKAMFGRRSAKGKTGLLEFLGVCSHMWCALRWQETGVGRKSHVLESHCVEFLKLDQSLLFGFDKKCAQVKGHEMTMRAWFHE